MTPQTSPKKKSLTLEAVKNRMIANGWVFHNEDYVLQNQYEYELFKFTVSEEGLK